MRTISRLVNPVNSVSDNRRGLAIANTRLHILREQLQRREDIQQNPSVTSTVGEPSRTVGTPDPSNLPPHLGWGSDRVSAQPNPALSRPKPTIEITVISVNEDREEIQTEETSNSSNKSPEHSQTLSVHPSLLVAFLKNEVAAIGRIYLLARSLDQKGCGWLTVDELRARLTGKSSPSRVCGWRRLRQILNTGKGVFWERDDFGRLWLYSTIRVAHNLHVTHFSGDVIKLPIQDLLGTIGDVRSTFYTTFHCGREPSPISRATLHTITGIPERTQRHYDKSHQTERLSNFSFVAQAGNQETAWQHGRAAFTFTDRQGKQGKIGESYTAIRLPNSYISTRYARISGKRKRLNQQLMQDLVNYGTQGNSNGQVRRLFFTDGKQAAKRFNRMNDVYLCDLQKGNTVFWTGWLRT